MSALDMSFLDQGDIKPALLAVWPDPHHFTPKST